MPKFINARFEDAAYKTNVNWKLGPFGTVIHFSILHCEKFNWKHIVYSIIILLFSTWLSLMIFSKAFMLYNIDTNNITMDALFAEEIKDPPKLDTSSDYYYDRGDEVIKVIQVLGITKDDDEYKYIIKIYNQQGYETIREIPEDELIKPEDAYKR